MGHYTSGREHCRQGGEVVPACPFQWGAGARISWTLNWETKDSGESGAAQGPAASRARPIRTPTSTRAARTTARGWTTTGPGTTARPASASSARIRSASPAVIRTCTRTFATIPCGPPTHWDYALHLPGVLDTASTRIYLTGACPSRITGRSMVTIGAPLLVGVRTEHANSFHPLGRRPRMQVDPPSSGPNLVPREQRCALRLLCLFRSEDVRSSLSVWATMALTSRTSAPYRPSTTKS
jgi:hypothetical protein